MWRWAVLALVVANGCAQSSRRDVPGDAPDLHELDRALIERRNRALCERELRCSHGDEIGALGPLCHPSARVAPLAPGEALDPDAREQCARALDRLELRDCRVPWGAPFDPEDDFWACYRGPQPRSAELPAGAPCVDWADCASGLWCDRERSCSTGRCVPNGALGEPCGLCAEGRCAYWEVPSTCVSTDRCGRSADCPSEGSEPQRYCVDGRCVAGEPPGYHQPCDPTLADRACGPGLTCEWSGETGFCFPPAALGEPCDPASCADGLACAAGVCALPPPGCHWGSDCPATAPYCHTPSLEERGVCTTEPRGAFCFTDAWMALDLWTACPPGFGCGGVEVGCVEEAPLGGACSAAVPCVLGAACVDGRCAMLVDPDAACGADAACPAAFECLDGRCTPWGMPGDACGEALPCLEGVCVEGTCTRLEPGAPCDSSTREPCETHCAPSTGVCEPRALVGETCLRASACDDGLACVSGVCARTDC